MKLIHFDLVFSRVSDKLVLEST